MDEPKNPISFSDRSKVQHLSNFIKLTKSGPHWLSGKKQKKNKKNDVGKVCSKFGDPFKRSPKKWADLFVLSFDKQPHCQ